MSKWNNPIKINRSLKSCYAMLIMFSKRLLFGFLCNFSTTFSQMEGAHGHLLRTRCRIMLVWKHIIRIKYYSSKHFFSKVNRTRHPKYFHMGPQTFWMVSFSSGYFEMLNFKLSDISKLSFKFLIVLTWYCSMEPIKFMHYKTY
jgi:hypothetical protein